MELTDYLTNGVKMMQKCSTDVILKLNKETICELLLFGKKKRRRDDFKRNKVKICHFTWNFKPGKIGFL